MAPQTTSIQHKIVVPSSVPMVSLLGSGDEFLRTIEKQFPAADLHVRGNEITVSGHPEDGALVERLVDELVLVLRTGQPLTADAVERSVHMLRAETSERPGELPTLGILPHRRPPTPPHHPN